MAKQAATSSSKLERTKKKRPGVHSKSKSSKLKQSKNYLKKTRGQVKKIKRQLPLFLIYHYILLPFLLLVNKSLLSDLRAFLVLMMVPLLDNP
jgi:hypothetical protein